jgi:hypothetical protein
MVDANTIRHPRENAAAGRHPRESAADGRHPRESGDLTKLGKMPVFAGTIPGSRI